MHTYQLLRHAWKYILTVFAVAFMSGCAMFGPNIEPLDEITAAQLIEAKTQQNSADADSRLFDRYVQYRKRSAGYYTGITYCNNSTDLMYADEYIITEDAARNVKVRGKTVHECGSGGEYELVGRHDGNFMFLRWPGKASWVWVYRLRTAAPNNYLTTTYNIQGSNFDAFIRPSTEFLTQAPYSSRKFIHFLSEEGVWKSEDGVLTYHPYQGEDYYWDIKIQCRPDCASFNFPYGTKLAKDVWMWQEGFFATPPQSPITLLSHDPRRPERQIKINPSLGFTQQLNQTLAFTQRMNQAAQASGLVNSSVRTTPSGSAATSANSSPPPKQDPGIQSGKSKEKRPASSQASEAKTAPPQAHAQKAKRAPDQSTASTGSATDKAEPSSDDGCETNVGWCASPGEESGSSDLVVRVSNSCPFRLLTKICIERKSGKWDCGQHGHQSWKSISHWINRQEATGRFSVKYVGSRNPSKDWVCASKVSNWHAP